jgi:26S proteasome regulatory subunit N10
LSSYSVDNSEYMRNGDILPTHLHAQQDAVNFVCLSKICSNPENNVDLLTLAKYDIIITYFILSNKKLYFFDIIGFIFI